MPMPSRMSLKRQMRSWHATVRRALCIAYIRMHGTPMSGQVHPVSRVTCTAGRLRMFMARAPYVSVESVSSAALAAGDTHATMSVSADPPSESMSRRVSLESRKGMCAPPLPPPLSASALITCFVL